MTRIPPRFTLTDTVCPYTTLFRSCREMIVGHRHVGLAPADRVTRLVVLDDELVLCAASGVLAGRDDERAVLGKPPFIVSHRILDQRRRAPVFGHIRLRLDAVAADHNPGHLLRLSLWSEGRSIGTKASSQSRSRRSPTH